MSVNMLMVFAIGLFAPFYAIFIQKIGGTIAFAGFSWAIFSIAAGGLTLLFTKWELRVKEQELLLALGYVLRGIVFLSYAFMHDRTQLIVTQLVWGLAFAIGGPAFDATYSAHIDKEKSIAEWGNWEGVASIATGIAALVGGMLIESFGYQAVFLSMAIISFSLGIYIWQLPREYL